LLRTNLAQIPALLREAGEKRNGESMPKTTIQTLREKRARKERMTFLTGYDYPFAMLEQKAGIDVILVGDSIGMVVYGYNSTLPVTVDLMMPHVKAVRLGAPDVYLVGDMPYMSYQTSKSEAIRNGGRFMAEGGCDAVKLEGGREMAETVRAMVEATIPVMAHIGLTPQSVAQLGGYKAQGRDLAAAKRLIEDSEILQEAGVCSVLLEAVPAEVAEIITQRSAVPVFGIGAGPHVDGQVLVIHDMIGMFDRHTPKFVKKYRLIGEQILEALTEFKEDVAAGSFPAREHCYPMPEDVAAELKKIYS
jgi:3-methyl-2-oxobutanoate hydroxymethyltransferase